MASEESSPSPYPLKSVPAPAAAGKGKPIQSEANETTSTSSEQTGGVKGSAVNSQGVSQTVNLNPSISRPKPKPRPVVTEDEADIKDPRGPYEDPRDPRGPTGPTGPTGPAGPDDDPGPDIVTSPDGGGPKPTEDAVGNPYITTSENNSIEVVTTADKMFYNTFSCPCSTYVIKDSNNEIGCEREYYGVKQYFKPLRRTNHFIENATPKLGDKWMCQDKTCTQSGYTFDGFYIVHAEENKSGPNSSIVNSKRYTENCFIPRALYFNDYTTIIPKEAEDAFKQSEVTTIGKVPIFNNETIAFEYAKLVNKEDIEEAIYYDWNGIKGYAPSDIIINNKIITGVWCGNKDLLKSGSPNGFFEKPNTSSRIGKQIVSSNGEIVTIRINGINNPSFTLTIKDSSGYSLLQEQIQNFDINDSGEYLLHVSFPTLVSNKDSETYDITFTPSGGSRYYYKKQIIPNQQLKHRLWQFKDPTVTISYQASGLTNTSTASATGDITFKGSAFSSKSVLSTYTITSTRSSGSALYYLKDQTIDFDKYMVRSGIIKKYVESDPSVETGYVGEFYVQDNTDYPGDIEVGMIVEGRIEKTKEILKIIPLDTKPDHDNVVQVGDRAVKTSKFEVDNTYDLFEGMLVTHNNFVSYIVSIDCEKTITIGHEEILHVGDSFIFSHDQLTTVTEVVDSSRTKGVKVVVNDGVYFPHRTELTFKNKSHSKVSGIIKVDKQGGSAIKVSVTINEVYFGQEDTTFSVDLSELLTKKPPIRDQYITVGKNSTSNIIHLINSNTSNLSDLQIGITTSPKNGEQSASTDREGSTIIGPRYYTPATNFTGNDSFKYNNSDGVTTSDEKTIYITVK